MDDLVKAIEQIKKDNTLLIADEASIKPAIVLRLLSLLGWNPFDVSEVKPEFTVGSKRVDYSLRINGNNKVFIEVKRPNEVLEPHQEQLLGYSFKEGVKIAILTNGFTWWFYLPLKEGNWEKRRFFIADFNKQSPELIADRLLAILSKDNIVSGESIKHAEDIWKSDRGKEELPRAWAEILNGPDEILVDLLAETCARLSGFPVNIEDVKKFILDISNGKEQIPQRQKVKVTIPKVYKSPFTIMNDYSSKKINYFVLFGKMEYPRNWKYLLVMVTEEIYRRHSSDFRKVLALRGPKKMYFSQNINEMRKPYPISNSDYYIETNESANSIVKRCHQLLTLFGHKESDLKIVTN